jgi:hypothetical protein
MASDGGEKGEVQGEVVQVEVCREAESSVGGVEGAGESCRQADEDAAQWSSSKAGQAQTEAC